MNNMLLEATQSSYLLVSYRQ